MIKILNFLIKIRMLMIKLRFSIIHKIGKLKEVKINSKFKLFKEYLGIVNYLIKQRGISI